MTPIAPIHTRHAAMTAGVTAALLLASAAAIAGDAPAAGPSITAVQVGSGFSQPLFVDAPPPPLEGQPADDRLFVVEKTGRIRILHPTTGTIEPTPFLDIAAQITTNSERGLLGLAFDPDFRQADNRYFYVNYTDLNGDTVIARYQVSATDPNLADLDSFTQITAFEQDFENHNGGSLAFGPDGMLYVATGDGGSGNDPNRRAQDLDYLLGKILRFDVNNEAGDFIPADNPYVGSTGRDEIWAVGLRNPFRISFDRLTGDLYIGDVGQDRREEINWQPAHAIGSMPGQGGYQGGRNYGWRCREGTVCTGLSQCTCPHPAFVDPIFEYAHGEQVIRVIANDTRNVTGGYVYRGAAIPSLQGMYLWAETGAGASYVGAFTNDAGTVRRELDLTAQLRRGAGSFNSIVSFGEDADGEVYLVSLGQGRILKIVQAQGADCGCDCFLAGCNEAIFADDFQTDQGWTTQGTATAGHWQRGVPIDDEAWDFDPFADADGSGACWLTENVNNPNYAEPFNTDVDNGSVELISPTIDMSMGGITICYSYLLNLNGSAAGDHLRVEINNQAGAGSWTTLRTHTADTNTSWFHAAMTQADLDAAGVALTPQMQVRFVAADVDPQSVVEAGVDAFAVFTSNGPGCATPCPCETDGTPGVDVFDLLGYLDLWFEADPAAELTGDSPASIDVFDLLAYLDCWFPASAGEACP